VRKSPTSFLITVQALSIASSPALAQSDPGSIERTVPTFAPPSGKARSTVPSVAAPVASQAKIEGQFILAAVNIDGATIFSSTELATTFEPYLASRIGQAELDLIVSAITQKYRDAGYLLSFAVLPEQSVASGIVRIRVVEGFIEDVRFEGMSRSIAAAKGIADLLKTERPVRRATMEHAIGLIRDLPGTGLGDVSLSRLPGDPSRNQLTLALSEDRLRVLNYADNRGTVDGARMRGYSAFNVASAVVPGDQAQLDLFTIPANRFRFFFAQGKYGLPMGDDGLRLTASAATGDQYQRLAGPDQKGWSRQLIVDLSYPFQKSRAGSLTGHIALADWGSKERRAGSTIQRDRIQVVRGWFDFMRAGRSRIDGKIGIAKGFDLWSATEKGDPLASRPGASGTFAKLNLDVQVTRALGQRVYLRADAAGQVASRPLLAPEEFALGGSRIGRAFDFNEVTGDHGFGGVIELGYRVGDVRAGPKAVDLFAYADGGGAFRQKNVPGFADSQWLAGTGVGARLTVAGVTMSGEVGVPLARTGRNRSPRAFIALTKAW
jgi:hemolysin activation/secretion protein